MEDDQDLCIGSVYVFGDVALPNMLLPGANHYT